MSTQRKNMVPFVLFIIYVVFSLYVVSLSYADTELTCNFNTTCGSQEIDVLRAENNTGGFVNSHAQLSNYTGDQYNYSLCCSSENQVVNESCSVTGNEEVVRLSNTSNAHVQAPNVTLNSTVYDYPVCLAGDGRMDCAVSSSSPGSNYECMGSMASSENNSGDYNLTNAHLADCGYYQTNIYCRLNNKPTQNTPILNSSSGENLSQDNLTVYAENLTDLDGNEVTPVFDWRVNDKSRAAVYYPFETDRTGNAEQGGIRDYTRTQENGTLGDGNASAVPTWNESCVHGGCYDFELDTDYMTIAGDDTFDLSGSVTLGAWVNWDDRGGSDSNIIVNDEVWLAVDASPGYKMYGQVGSGFADSSGDQVPGGVWNQLYMVFDQSTGNLTFYINGSESFSKNIGSQTYSTSGKKWYINQWLSGKDKNDGRMDEIRIYNRSLSQKQIKKLYEQGNASLNQASSEDSRTLVSEETSPGENYTVKVTANDGIEDGQTLTSNSLYVRSLNVTTFAPSGDITDRKPVFNWSEDSSADRYELNVTAPSSVDCFGFYEDNITSSSFNSTQELCTDLDYDSSAESFTWKVRSCSGGSCSAWSNDSFDVNSVNSISLVNSSVSFGDLLPGDVDNTTNGSASPLVVRNEGNIRVDLDVSANESLFDNVALNNSNFQLQSGVNDANAFNESGSVSSWLNVTNSSQNLIKRLKYFDTEQDANVDIRVKVPDQEPTGSKTSTITVESIPNE